MSDTLPPIDVRAFQAQLLECDPSDAFDDNARRRYEGLLLSALQSAPGSSRLLCLVADLHSMEEMGNEESIRRLHEAIRADPLSPQPYESLGRISLFKADFEASADWFRKSLDAEKNVPAFLGLALALKEAGSGDEALKAIDSARQFVAHLMDEVCSFSEDFTIRDSTTN